MKLLVNRTPNTKRLAVSASLLTLSGLTEESALEFQAGQNTLVAFPARMTAMELVNVVDTLHKLTVDMSVELAKLCGACDSCGMCDCTGFYEPVYLPPGVLEEAGLSPGCKLTANVDEDGIIRVEEAGHEYDLGDVPDHILDSLRQSKACLAELEDKLMLGEIVYGKQAAEILQ